VVEAYRPVTGWLQPIRRPAHPAGRLVCLPHAGGGTIPFRSWPARLPAEVEVLAALLPGREARLDEAPSRDLATVVDELAAALRGPGAELPTVLFGHSLGAFVGYELCRRMGPGAPFRHLVVSGARAPHRPPTVRPVADLPLLRFVDAVRELGGTSREVFDEPVLLELLLPALRADFSLAEGYLLPAPVPVPVRLTVLGGSDDPVTPVDALRDWQSYSTVGCSVRIFPGDHFFTVAHQEAVLAVVAEALRAATG
jgi:surfactin synthase thioesterase subunit